MADEGLTQEKRGARAVLWRSVLQIVRRPLMWVGMIGLPLFMMLFIGWGSPAGVLLFWATSSIFALAQNLINRKLLKHEDDVKEAECAASHPEPVKVQVVRKEKKKRPTKKH